jgi:hypothetical protein
MLEGRMAKVFTKLGMVDRADLEMRPVLFEEEGGTTVALEWRMKGTPTWDLDSLVRRSVWHDMHTGLPPIGVEQGKFNGQ